MNNDKNGLFGLHKQAVAVVRELMINGTEETRLKAAMWVLDKTAIEADRDNTMEAIREDAKKLYGSWDCPPEEECRLQTKKTWREEEEEFWMWERPR